MRSAAAVIAAALLLPLTAAAEPLVSLRAGADRLDLGPGEVSAAAASDALGGAAVHLSLADGPAAAVADLTGAHLGEAVEVLVCGEVVMAPVVRERIEGGKIMISGQMRRADARAMAARINSGSCPGG